MALLTVVVVVCCDGLMSVMMSGDGRWLGSDWDGDRWYERCGVCIIANQRGVTSGVGWVIVVGGGGSLHGGGREGLKWTRSEQATRSNEQQSREC